jgi:hypothetical protein
VSLTAVFAAIISLTGCIAVRWKYGAAPFVRKMVLRQFRCRQPLRQLLLRQFQFVVVGHALERQVRQLLPQSHGLLLD